MSVFQSKEQKDLLMTLLKVLGGYKVEVAFDGSGDSGNIGYVSLLDQESKDIDLSNATFDWFEKSSEFEAGKWQVRYKPYPAMPVRDILQNICENALENSGHDWYNNDGGYGTLNIDLTTTPPAISLSVSIRYTHTDDYEIDLNEEEEEENK